MTALPVHRLCSLWGVESERDSGHLFSAEETQTLSPFLSGLLSLVRLRAPPVSPPPSGGLAVIQDACGSRQTCWKSCVLSRHFFLAFKPGCDNGLSKTSSRPPELENPCFFLCTKDLAGGCDTGVIAVRAQRGRYRLGVNNLSSIHPLTREHRCVEVKQENRERLCVCVCVCVCEYRLPVMCFIS